MVDYLISLLLIAALWGTLGIAYQWSAKEAGLVTLSLGAMFGVGAYAFAVFEQHISGQALLGIAVAGVLAAMLGGVTYLALHRVSPDEFVIGTLAVQYVVVDAFSNLDSVTGGPLGMAGITPLQLTGFSNLYVEFGLALILMIIVITLSSTIYSGPFRRKLNVTRDDEILSTSLGVSTSTQRLLIGCIIGCVSGVCGAIIAQYVSYIEPMMFSNSVSISVILIVLVAGGRRSWSPVIGGVFYVALPEILRSIKITTDVAAHLRELVFAAILLGIVFYRSVRGRETFTGGKDVSL